MSFVELIPWKTREMEILARAFLSHKKLILIRAPAGMGKTSVAAAYLVSKAIIGARGAIFLRTRSEVEHTLKILGNIIERMDSDLLVVPTPSKQDFCVVRPGVPLIKYWCPASDCDRMRRRQYSDVEQLLRGKVYTDFDSYLRIMSTGRRCPYQICQELLGRADIIVGTHPYFIHPDLFKRMGKLDLVLIDEAHNLIGITTYEGDQRCVEEGKIVAEEALENGYPIHKYVVRLWRSGDTERAKVLAEYDAYKNEPGIDVRIDGKILRILPPIRLIRERLEEVDKIILMSSTLYPSSFFQKIFADKIDHEIVIIPGLLKSPKRKIIVMDTELTTARYRRNEETFRRYALEISRIYRKLKTKIIVFCPSYEVAEGIAKHLNIKVTNEPRGEIVITVFRGRISEGVDIPDEYRVAIMAGLPYPRLTKKDEKIIEIYSREYGIDKRSLRHAMVTSSMISALIQAAGRVGRKNQGLVIILDARGKKIFGGSL